jgi:hypothetical protein
MARKVINKGSKRDRQKGVNKKKRDGSKPLSYKLNTKNKPGPKVKSFDGETVGHVTNAGIVLMNQKKPKEKKARAEIAA